MKSITIYHNPRCSKSRQTLKLIEDKGYKPEVIEYLKTPPDQKTIKQIIALLGISLSELVRNTETAYKELSLDHDSTADEKLIQIMIENPILIQRPIVIVDNKHAVIGRPPENINDIL